MRAYLQNKRLSLLLAVLALGALTVLAISLNEVPFREGQHFGRQGMTTVEFFPEDRGQAWVDVPIWKQILVWGLVGLMVILIALLLSPEMRRRLLRILFRVAVTAWALYFLIKRGIIGPNLFGNGEAPSSQDTIIPVPAFEPPQ